MSPRVTWFRSFQEGTSARSVPDFHHTERYALAASRTNPPPPGEEEMRPAASQNNRRRDFGPRPRCVSPWSGRNGPESKALERARPQAGATRTGEVRYESTRPDACRAEDIGRRVCKPPNTFALRVSTRGNFQ